MKLLTRYVLVEFSQVLLVTLAATTVLMIVAGVVVEASKQGIGLLQTIQLIPYLLPEAMRYTVPFAALFASCSVFGRMSSSNEVVAAKALGISPMAFLWPALTLGFLLSLLSVWLNEVAVTWGRVGVQSVIVNSVEQIAYGMLRTQKSYSAGRLAITVKAVEGRDLIKPTLTLKGTQEKPNITVTANKADLNSDLEAGKLTIRFFNAVIDVGDGRGAITWPGPYLHTVDFSDVSKKPDVAGGPSSRPLSLIPSEIEDQKKLIDKLEQESAAVAAMQMMTGKFEQLVDSGWKGRRDRIGQAWGTLHRLRTEPSRRWAGGFSCLCFVMVGAPFAIYFRRGEFWTNFAVCVSPVLLIYYPFLMGTLDRAKTGALPPYSVWLGNIVLAIWGFWLLRRVVRY